MPVTRTSVAVVYDTWQGYVDALRKALPDEVILEEDFDAITVRGRWRELVFASPNDQIAWDRKYGALAGALAAGNDVCGRLGSRDVTNALYPLRAALAGIAGFRFKLVDGKLIIAKYTKVDYESANAA